METMRPNEVDSVLFGVQQPGAEECEENWRGGVWGGFFAAEKQRRDLRHQNHTNRGRHHSQWRKTKEIR